MKNKNSLKFIFIAAGVYILIIFIIFFLLIKYIESPVVAAIIGTFVGSIGGIFGLVIGAWNKDRELKEKIEDRAEQLKDRSSKYALELTKMDFELRQKSLKLTKNKKHFLAPAKVYRELYKALLELHGKGTWPKTIQELGLLSIFLLGPEEEDNKK